MKNVTLASTSLGLLMAAGVCVPLSAVGGEEYILWHSQGSRPTQQYADAHAEPGTAGQIRMEAMALEKSHGEYALYSNTVSGQQFSSVDTSAPRGAQGPIRTEDVSEVNRRFGEDALYYNVARLHQVIQ